MDNKIARPIETFLIQLCVLVQLNAIITAINESIVKMEFHLLVVERSGIKWKMAT